MKDYNSMGLYGTSVVKMDTNIYATYKKEYDTKGDIVKEIDPLNNIVTYSYYEDGNLKDSTDSQGNKITYYYDNYLILYLMQYL